MVSRYRAFLPRCGWKKKLIGISGFFFFFFWCPHLNPILSVAPCYPEQYVHALGLIHRDIKPQNIFVSYDRRQVLRLPVFFSFCDALSMGIASKALWSCACEITLHSLCFLSRLARCRLQCASAEEGSDRRLWARCGRPFRPRGMYPALRRARGQPRCLLPTRCCCWAGRQAGRRWSLCRTV